MTKTANNDEHEIMTFCETHKITKQQFLGLEKYDGTLVLESLTSIPKEFNPTVGGSLYLNSLTSIPKGFNPTVGRSIYLNSLSSIPKGFNPIVGGTLYLSSLTSIPKGFNPTVGGSLDLYSLTSIPKGFNPAVGGYLNLKSLTSVPKGFNPTVGGSLFLNSLTSIPKRFNPTVGGSLVLNSLTSIPKRFNPTVGGDLYLESSSKSIQNIPDGYIFSWADGKYISVDGIFCEVINKKHNVYKVKKVNKSEIFYIVGDGQRWSHGDSISEARDSLMYKIGNRDTSRFKGMSIDTELSLSDMIECYRVITGACEFGVRSFITNTVGTVKEVYTIKEVINLTIGQFGHDTFKNFFR